MDRFYIVLNYPYESDDPACILGVFTDEKAAEACCAKHKDEFEEEYRGAWWIRRFEVVTWNGEVTPPRTVEPLHEVGKAGHG